MSIEWAVGLFEGEGSIFRDKRCSTWTLQLRMTDRDVVERFAEIDAALLYTMKVINHDEYGQDARLVIAGLAPNEKTSNVFSVYSFRSSDTAAPTPH